MKKKVKFEVNPNHRAQSCLRNAVLMLDLENEKGVNNAIEEINRARNYLKNEEYINSLKEVERL